MNAQTLNRCCSIRSTGSDLRNGNIRFGVGGFPPKFTKGPSGKIRSNIFSWLEGLGLNAMELQMTRGPRMNAETCRLYHDLSAEHNIRLSIHGSYYIVLGSSEPEKVARSYDTLMRTFELADKLNAREIIIHPGSLYGQSEAEASARFINGASTFMQRLGRTETRLFIETAGKVGQLGSVDAIFNMSSQIDGVEPCIDFGHVHARTLGSLNCENGIDKLFDQIHEFARQWPEKRFHFHYTPIHYGQRGEIQHRALGDIGRHEDQNGHGLFHPRPEPIAIGLLRLHADFTVISETLDSQQEGALALQHSYRLKKDSSVN